MNEIEKQKSKIEKEKEKLKLIQKKIEKERFKKVYEIIGKNFDNLNENLKVDLKNYFDFSIKKNINQNKKDSKII